MTLRTRIAACAVLLCTAPLVHAAPSGGAFEWSVVPYAWLTSFNTDVQLARLPEAAGGFTKFEDVVDKVDSAFLIHGEGQGDEFGVFSDFIFLGLEDSNQRQSVRTETDIDARIFEVAAVWAPNAERGRGFETFAGLRMIDMDVTFQLIPNEISILRARIDGDDMYADLMLGARYTVPLSDRWSLTLRGDGSWGGTNGTWNASAVALYQMRNGAWAFGWRHLDIDLDIHDGSTFGVALDGPQVGYAFQF